MARNCLHPYNNLKNIEKQWFHFRTLLYFVTTIKKSNQLCSLFPSRTVLLFTTKKRNKLRICNPSQTNYGMLTFFSLPTVYCKLPRLLTFSCFSNSPLISTPLYSGVESMYMVSKFLVQLQMFWAICFTFNFVIKLFSDKR